MKKTLIAFIFAIAVILTTSVLASAAQLSLDSNTIALWHFNENSGNTLFDETLNNNDGTITGANWTLDSISGSALEFDGIDDKISIAKTSSVDLTDEVTLESNIKRKSGTDGMIISKNGPYFMAIRNNVIVGGIYANGGGSNTWTESSGTTILQQNIWYYLKITYNRTAINVYIDNNLENSTPKTGQMPQVSQSTFLGWGEPGHDQFFTGIIDDARISDIARNSASNNSQNSTEPRLSAIESLIASIQNTLASLIITINTLTTRVDNLESQNNSNTSPNYFKYMGVYERKQLICNYAQKNRLVNYIDLGWNCTVRYRTINNNTFPTSCNCLRFS